MRITISSLTNFCTRKKESQRKSLRISLSLSVYIGYLEVQFRREITPSTSVFLAFDLSGVVIDVTRVSIVPPRLSFYLFIKRERAGRSFLPFESIRTREMETRCWVDGKESWKGAPSPRVLQYVRTSNMATGCASVDFTLSHRGGWTLRPCSCTGIDAVNGC